MNVQVAGKPLRKRDVWLRQSEDENAIFDPDTEQVHVLNATALAIWVLCDGETEPDEMIDAAVQLSGLPREVVEEDVLRVLHQFDHAGILTWED